MRMLSIALLLTTTLASGETFNDGWRFNDVSSKANPFFSEFKYFNFQDEELSGVMTYSVISPGLSRTLKIDAYFYEGGKLHSIQKSYPLKCVTASKTSPQAEICGDGRIEVLSWGPDFAKLRVVQETGPIHWDLTYTTRIGDVTGETHIPLDGGLVSRAAGFKWFMNWAPVFGQADVEGRVNFVDSGRVFAVSTPVSYHDENWEVWNPKTQPFNWLHFTGRDSAGEPVTLTLVEFPNNSSKSVGLALTSGGRRNFWAPGQYKLEKLDEGFIPTTRRYGATAEELRTRTVDPLFEEGYHRIPTRYRITTSDLQLEAELKVFAALSTTSAKPGDEDAVRIDEQLFQAEIRFLSGSGDPRTASGPGEFMNTLTGD